MSDIRIKVIVDGQESIQTIDELNKSLDSFKKNTSDLGDGSKEVDDFNKSIEDLQKTLDGGLSIDPSKINQTLDSVSAELTNLTGQSFDIKVDILDTTFKSIDELQVKLEDGFNLDTSKIDQSLDSVSSKLDNITEKSFDINVDVQEIDNGVESIDELQSKLKDGLNLNTDEFNNKIQNISTELNNITDKSFDINVDTQQIENTIESIDGLKTNLEDGLNLNTDELNNKIGDVKNELNLLTEQPFDISLDISETSVNSINELQSKLDSGLNLNTDDFNNKIDESESKLDELTNKEFDIKVDVPKSTFESIDNLKSKLDDGLDLNTDRFDSKLGDVKNELSILGEEPIDINIDIPENSVNSINEIRNAIKAAKDEASNADFGSPEFVAASEKAGVLKDRLDDINEAVAAQTGEPIERLGQQFSGLGESILKLDFGKATTQLNGLKNTAGQINFSKIGKDAADFGKVLGGSVTNAVSTLGKALLANPIFLIAGIITTVVLSLNQLKDNFGIVQLAIDKLTAPIKFLVDGFKSLSDAIGLSNFKESENLEKTTIAYENRLKVIEKSSSREQELAQARGASAEELLKLEEDAAKKIIEANEQQLASNQKLSDYLEGRIARGIPLVEKEKEQYEQLKKTVEDLETAQFNLQVITLKSATLRADSAEKETKKNEEESKKARDIYSKYLKELDTLRTQYILTEEQRINKRYDDELKKIKGNTDLERQLRKEIEEQRIIDINNFNAKELQANLVVQEKIRANELQIQTNKALESAETAQQILDIETALANNLFNLELERINRIEQEQIRVANGNKDLILQAQTDAQVALDNAEKVRIDTIQASNQKIIDERKKQIDDETNLVITSVQTQSDELQKERDRVFQNIGAGIGILGSLDKLKGIFEEEKALVKKQYDDLKAINDRIISDQNTSEKEKEDARNRNIDLEKQYQEQLTTINQEESDLRTKITEDEIALRTQQIGDIISIVNSVGQAQIDSERTALEVQSTELDAYYEREKERINESITDENARAEALANLDRMVEGSKLDLERKNIDLQKREIKRERNATLASVGLAAAQTLANALSASKGFDPISFALALAANLAAAYAAIKKAKDALKQADSAVSAAGAGGGGGSSLPTPTGGGGGGGGTAQSFVPTGFGPAGINPAGGQNNNNNNGVPPPTQQFVSVVEIERVRNSVITTETNNTIG